MKIKCKNATVKSTNIIVPVDGKIAVDANGVAEVSPKCAGILVSCTSDWEIVKDGSKSALEKQAPAEGTEHTETAEEAPATEAPEEGTEEEEKEQEKAGEEVTEESLDAMTVAQLKEMCAEAGFDEKEYKNLSKKLLIAYMLKKINGK